MPTPLRFVRVLFTAMLLASGMAGAQPGEQVVANAAEPCVVWNAATKSWWMFVTDCSAPRPGHASIMTVEGREWFCHFYDGTQHGRPTYALRPPTWDAAGWPVLGRIK